MFRRVSHDLRVRSYSNDVKRQECVLELDAKVEDLLRPICWPQARNAKPIMPCGASCRSSRPIERMAMMLPHVADYDAKRRILEIVCLNCKFDGASPVPEI